MGLLNRDDLAKQFLDGTQRHFEAQVSRLTADIDNLLANSVGIDDHARIDNALAGLFEKLSAEKDNWESVREYRQQRQL
jgi:hypothetical protein